MTSTTRLRLSLAVIVLSAVYAILIAQDPAFATAIAAGYVGLLLTVIVVINVWKKP